MDTEKMEHVSLPGETESLQIPDNAGILLLILPEVKLMTGLAFAILSLQKCHYM